MSFLRKSKTDPKIVPMDDSVPNNTDEVKDGLTEADFDKAFNAFSGGLESINSDIIMKIMKDNNVAMTLDEVTHLIKEVDTDGNGTVELDEFRDMMKNAQTTKNSSAQPFVDAGKRQALKIKRAKLKEYSNSEKTSKQAREKVRTSMRANPTQAEQTAKIPVQFFGTQNTLHWQTRERLEWNVYFAESNLVRLAIVQPFKDDGWTQYDCMACDLKSAEEQIRLLRKESEEDSATEAQRTKSAKAMKDLKHARGNNPSNETPPNDPDVITKQQIADFLAARVKYTPSDTPDQPITLQTSASATDLRVEGTTSGGLIASQSQAGLATAKDDVLKKGSGTVLIARLAGDTFDLQQAVPGGLVVPAVKTNSTAFRDSDFIAALSDDIQAGIAEAGAQSDKSSRYMKAASASVDIFKTLALNFEKEKNMNKWRRKWRKNVRRVMSMLAVDQYKIILKERGYDASYLGETRPLTIEMLHAPIE